MKYMTESNFLEHADFTEIVHRKHKNTSVQFHFLPHINDNVIYEVVVDSFNLPYINFVTFLYLKSYISFILNNLIISS